MAIDWDGILEASKKSTGGELGKSKPIWSGYVQGELSAGAEGVIAEKKYERELKKYEKEEALRSKIATTAFKSFLKLRKGKDIEHKTYLKEQGITDIKGKSTDEFSMFEKVRSKDLPKWKEILGVKKRTDYINFNPQFIEKMKSDPSYAIDILNDPQAMNQINDLIKDGYLKPGELQDVFLNPETQMPTDAGVDLAESLWMEPDDPSGPSWENDFTTEAFDKGVIDAEAIEKGYNKMQYETKIRPAEIEKELDAERIAETELLDIQMSKSEDEIFDLFQDEIDLEHKGQQQIKDIFGIQEEQRLTEGRWQAQDMYESAQKQRDIFQQQDAEIQKQIDELVELQKVKRLKSELNLRKKQEWPGEDSPFTEEEWNQQWMDYTPIELDFTKTEEL